VSDAPAEARRSVTILACHYESGQSMRRYGRLLATAYQQTGWDVEVLQPTRIFSRHIRRSSLRKLSVYLEKLVLFPLSLSRRIRPGNVVHITDHSDAPWLRRTQKADSTIITCHDLIAIDAAAGRLDEHRTRFSGRLYQGYIERSLQRADLIAAVSEVTLAGVRSLLPSRPSALLHNPLPPRVTSAITKPSVPAVASPYLLLVAASGWRKRRHLAVGAWRRLREAVDVPLRLVIVGDALSPAEQALLKPDGPADGIDVLSDLTDDELAGLYAHAAGALVLSSHEGFGWPVVEANYWGTVVICSDLPVLREVGPNDLFVGTDLDTVDWTGIWGDLQDPDRQHRVRADAERFDPAVFATQLNVLASGVRTRPAAAEART
jgi:glycosyltransferase involved in cell wall biosynthesis